jgi:hypothetical protein
MAFSLGIVALSQEQSVLVDAVVLADKFRRRGVAVSIAHGRKSPKSQVRALRRDGYADYLLYFDGGASFEAQDTFEYPEWMTVELGTANFERTVWPSTDAGVEAFIETI